MLFPMEEFEIIPHICIFGFNTEPIRGRQGTNSPARIPNEASNIYCSPPVYFISLLIFFDKILFLGMHKLAGLQIIFGCVCVAQFISQDWDVM